MLDSNDNRMSVKVPVYLHPDTHESLKDLKSDIENKKGVYMSLSQLMRDSIIHFLKNHRDDVLNSYEKKLRMT